jgi:Gly-Xaa carboxypeptidase
VKVNALPEEAHAIVNHRVAVDDSINGYVASVHSQINISLSWTYIDWDLSIQERYVALLSPEAAKFNLSVVSTCCMLSLRAMTNEKEGFGDVPSADATHYVRLESPGGAEASPVTPAEGAAWECILVSTPY